MRGLKILVIVFWYAVLHIITSILLAVALDEGGGGGFQMLVENLAYIIIGIPVVIAICLFYFRKDFKKSWCTMVPLVLIAIYFLLLAFAPSLFFSEERAGWPWEYWS